MPYLKRKEFEEAVDKKTIYESSLRNLITSIVDSFAIKFKPHKVLSISFRKHALIFWGPHNYIKVIHLYPCKEKGKYAFELLGYHDSCWRDSVNRFISDLDGIIYELAGFQGDVNEPGFYYHYTVHSIQYPNLRDLPKNIRDTIIRIDYDRNGSEGRRERILIVKDDIRELKDILGFVTSDVLKPEDLKENTYSDVSDLLNEAQRETTWWKHSY